jgi:hypothetical protein
MSEHPAYVIVGRGRWAQRMNVVLRGEDRRVAIHTETRRAPQESHEAYRVRLSEAIRATGAQVAWLCVPPGEHLSTMIEAVLDARIHAVIEPPWLVSAEQTSDWIDKAKCNALVFGVHFEYCLLERLNHWKSEYRGAERCHFGGMFRHSRRDHLGLPPIDVLGTHLLSIREFAAPHASVTKIDCGYELADQRRVWLDLERRRVDEIDFTYCREPLIQRYVARLEGAISGGDFAFGLEFASQVMKAAERTKHNCESAVVSAAPRKSIF